MAVEDGKFGSKTTRTIHQTKTKRKTLTNAHASLNRPRLLSFISLHTRMQSTNILCITHTITVYIKFRAIIMGVGNVTFSLSGFVTRRDASKLPFLNLHQSNGSVKCDHSPTFYLISSSCEATPMTPCKGTRSALEAMSTASGHLQNRDNFPECDPRARSHTDR
mgnify:FL=1